MFCKQYDDYCAYLIIMVIMMCIPYENDCLIMVSMRIPYDNDNNDVIPYDNDCYDYDAHT